MNENIEKYFPGNVIMLTGDVQLDMQMLRDICNNPDKYQKNIDVKQIKNRIFLLNNLDELYINK